MSISEPSTPASAPEPAPVKSSQSRGVKALPDSAILCIDVGGSGIKGGVIGTDGTPLAERIRIPTPHPLDPEKLIEIIASIAEQSPPAARVAVGFPGMVRAGVVLSAPNLVTRLGAKPKVVPAVSDAWEHFPLADRIAAELGVVTRVGNDADVQGLAAIRGVGMEVVITLGTGMGFALFLDGILAPHLELGHHPLRKGKGYDDLLGDAARRKVGNARWSARVDEAVGTIAALTFYDTLYIGGGNASKLTKAFTRKATIVDNADGILGGARLWALAKMP